MNILRIQRTYKRIKIQNELKRGARMDQEHDLLKILEDAEEDVVSGRVSPMQDTFENIRKTFKESEVVDVM